MNRLSSDNDKLKEASNAMFDQMQVLELERQKGEQRVKELEEELDNVDQGVDSEMELRVQYEGRLNKMYTEYRELETKIAQLTEKEEM